MTPADDKTTPARPVEVKLESSVTDGAAGASVDAVGTVAVAPTGPPGTAGKRSVCDHCRRRRIRCDGRGPCQQCMNASLVCRRDHVPRKRGPKRGHGRVINELRALESQDRQRGVREHSIDLDLPMDDQDGPQPTTPNIPSTPERSWTQTSPASEMARSIPGDQYRPTSRSYSYLVPQCVDLYYEHIYPIMPVIHIPSIRKMIHRPMTPSERNFIFALCAKTCLHMSGKSIHAAGPDSWEAAGRFFLDECVAVRKSYDFMEDVSLYAVLSSFWLSTSHFELDQCRKSWLFLREALTLAIDMGLDDESTYAGLPPEEKLLRQRVFWQLFVTERSYAVLRNKPITFKKTPSLPTTRHPYETPDVHFGFLQLISSYIPLDENFVTAWNDGSDPHVTASTYLSLQELLSAMPPFVSQAHRPERSSLTSPGAPTIHTPYIKHEGGDENGLDVDSIDASSSSTDQPEPTAIQKADLLITQQWLRLIVWQSSFKQGLLTGSASHESMHFAFPLAIARRTAAVLHSLPSVAVEVHGMGIFEKIFEIGTWCINVLGAYDKASIGGSGPQSSPGPGELAFINSLDMGVLGVGRKSTSIDPLEFFVRTLSATPSSRTRFAEKLLMFASERPGGLTMALVPGLSPPGAEAARLRIQEMTGSNRSGQGSAPRPPTGTVLGEVYEREAADEDAVFEEEMSGAPGGVTMPGAEPHLHGNISPALRMPTSMAEADYGLVSPPMASHRSGLVEPGIPSPGLSAPAFALPSPAFAPPAISSAPDYFTTSTVITGQYPSTDAIPLPGTAAIGNVTYPPMDLHSVVQAHGGDFPASPTQQKRQWHGTGSLGVW